MGAVILTNADTGGLMLGPFRRRFLEVLFDGKPEAMEDVTKSAENFKAVQAKFRERLTLPADPEPAGRLAAHYTSPELGELTIRRQGTTVIFDLGEWRSTVASRKNDDGTISFMTISPGASGFEFVEAKRNDKRALIAFLAQGHVLIEDVPGTGKTMLARAIARSIDGVFRRVQFTPDLLPADITGTSIFNQKISQFEFHPGPIFANVILADEINRATPKTQSSLLEAMEEFQVTADGVTRPLPRPFFVIATQNSVEYQGTFPLPDFLGLQLALVEIGKLGEYMSLFVNLTPAP